MSCSRHAGNNDVWQYFIVMLAEYAMSVKFLPGVLYAVCINLNDIKDQSTV
jgi:hypothetical protein